MADHPVSGLQARIHVPGRLEASLAAEPGSVVAVIGPNGAGKTTLLRALAGLVEMTGSVTVAGESWTDPARLVRERHLGFVFQDQSLFPHLSALANVAFGPRSRGARRAAAEATAQGWLDRLGVADLAARRPGQLSGGQAQRVAIARALATDPALLLLDEPFAGLDVGVASALRVELARHLAGYDGVALLVTHDAIDALTLADRVLVLDEGRVAQDGTPGEVAAHPRTDHVARLVGLNVLREGDTFRSFSPRAVTVSLLRPEGSARHRWRGAVVSAAPHGDAVRLLVSADTDLLADVTPAAVGELDLLPGREVWLSVKETAVQTYGAP
ncbi:ABC transporter ATP-binding protein [Nocardioides sp. cx-173]|uniref:ABC transporter ATP-binding protein n=1 Tax=Nocardioides sp. cx-173 TaxID=2898796 RepID=UPI001E59CE63|nr:ABC transporter ATP-binding protein [Nocardioides sp. cx-173]MCD4525556.1 ABC transporter ATP-binding protein [Nocardioides sp. cx-173]UGB42700.1 ABC transporter ATP-binding protein [Nocardioides sp. cx-173]